MNNKEKQFSFYQRAALKYTTLTIEELEEEIKCKRFERNDEEQEHDEENIFYDYNNIKCCRL